MALNGDHQARGESKYRQGYFKAALVEFNMAIEAKEGDLIGLLDARCGTYEKLDQIDVALREARKIIKLAPTDPRGYLRAGRILLLTKKTSNAYDVYWRGFLNVSPSNPKRNIIQAQLQKIEAVVKPKKQLVDPFTRLPLETASLVLQNLDFYSIVTCLRVCKDWSRVLKSLPELWHTVDFSRAKRLVHVSEVRACIRQTNSKCRKVVLKRVSDPNKSLLNDVMIRSPHLEYIESDIALRSPEIISGSQKVKTLILSGSTVCPINDIQRVVMKCPNLERAEFHAVFLHFQPSWTTPLEKLKVLKIVGLVRQSISLLDAAFKMAPNLEELSLANLTVTAGHGEILNASTFPSLRSLTLNDMHMEELSCFPSLLEELTIANCTASTHHLDASAVELKNLKALGLTNCDKELISWLDAVMYSSDGSIERLDLTRCVHLAKVNFIQYITRSLFEKLKELLLSYNDVDDTVISEMVKSTLDLEVIDLSHTAVSGIAIKQLVQTQKKLRKIIVRHCHNVGLDAVEFARHKGIRVDNSNPDNKKRKYARKIQG